MNNLDQNQIIDVISSKVSQVHNIDKNKVTKALIVLIDSTKAKNDDVMKYLRQIATIIIKNPHDPVSNKLIKMANAK